MKTLIKISGLVVLAVGIAGSARATLPVTTPAATLWLDANNVDGSNNSTLVNGSPVGTWKDLSGNGLDLTQSTAGAKPTFVTGVMNSGYSPVVRFNGTSDVLVDSLASAYSGQLHTVFVVLKATKPASEQDFFDTGNGGNNNFRVSYVDSNGIHIFRGGGSFPGGGDIVNPNYTSGQYLIFGAVWDGSGGANSSSIFLNGANQTSGTLTNYGNATTMSVGSSSPGSSFYNGDIAEVILYNGLLSHTDFQAVENYLNQEWFIPEPSTVLLLGVGGLCCWYRRPRTRRNN